MAFTRNYYTNGTPTDAAVRTANTANGEIIIGLRVTNTTASAVKATVYLDALGANVAASKVYLVGGATNSTMGADIPVGGSLVVVNGDADKIVLLNTDVIKVTASAGVSVVMSVLTL